MYPMVVVVMLMGVSGTGKTTIGKTLRDILTSYNGKNTQLILDFIEGDELHPSENIQKMRNGIPLEDQDRWPWLENIQRAINPLIDTQRPIDCTNHVRVIIATCSLLKKKYRTFILGGLAGAATVCLVNLHGPLKVLKERIEQRGSSHFMPSALLQSQFDTLEHISQEEVAKSSFHLIDIDVSLLSPLDSAHKIYNELLNIFDPSIYS